MSARRNGFDRPSLRPLLQNIQAFDGHNMFIDLARSGGKGKNMGMQPRSPDSRGDRYLFRNSGRRNVWRTFRNSDSSGDGLHFLVQGGGGFSLGLLLETREWKDILFPSGARIVPDLLSARSSDRYSKRGSMGGTRRFSLG